MLVETDDDSAADWYDVACASMPAKARMALFIPEGAQSSAMFAPATLLLLVGPVVSNVQGSLRFATALRSALSRIGAHSAGRNHVHDHLQLGLECRAIDRAGMNARDVRSECASAPIFDVTQAIDALIAPISANDARNAAHSAFSSAISVGWSDISRPHEWISKG